jgi:regulator of sigma E protease
MTVLAFVLVLGPLVFVHELGHYLVGRWFGVKAEEFSIGFGREVAGWTDRLGTRWKLAMLPLGGYVRFAGDMNAASQPSPEWLALPAAERARTFQAKPVWQRALIVAAGPLTNFLLAIVILASFATIYGVDRTPAVAQAVEKASAAQKAGLQPGDRITAIDGRSMTTFEDLYGYVVMRPDARVEVELDRGGAPIRVPVTLGVRIEQDHFGNKYRLGLLGIRPPTQRVYERVPLWEAPGEGVRQVVAIVQSTVDGLGQIITGRRSMDDLGGPLKIARVSGEALALGWPALIGLIAMMSINLGFINLLPVPVLDGGHLLFYAIEGIRRRPVEPHVQEWAFRGGLAAILALMLLVTFNDLSSFGVWKNLVGLIS